MRHFHRAAGSGHGGSARRDMIVAAPISAICANLLATVRWPELRRVSPNMTMPAAAKPLATVRQTATVKTILSGTTTNLL